MITQSFFGYLSNVDYRFHAIHIPILQVVINRLQQNFFLLDLPKRTVLGRSLTQQVIQHEHQVPNQRGLALILLTILIFIDVGVQLDLAEMRAGMVEIAYRYRLQDFARIVISLQFFGVDLYDL